MCIRDSNGTSPGAAEREDGFMKKYAIGVDYGTLSGRALLIDCATGEELASAVFDYPHGVMDCLLYTSGRGRDNA